MLCMVKKCQFNKCEGYIDPVYYEFVCKYSNPQERNNGSFFIQNINMMVNDSDNRFEQCDDQAQFQNKSFLAGFVYCKIHNLAVNLSNQFISLFKQNLYFQLGQYEEAFQNSIQNFIDFINSFEIQSLTLDSEKDGFLSKNDKSIAANFMIKLNDKIYFSNPLSENDWIWGIKMKQEENFIQILKQQLTQVNQQTYLLKEDLIKDIDEIILSNRFDEWEKINDVNFLNNYPKFETVFAKKQLNYLKIKNNQQ